MSVCLLLGRGGVFSWVSSFGSVARHRPNNDAMRSFVGSVARQRPRGNIFLLIIFEYKIRGALSPGVKRSGREAEIQPDLQKGEVVKSRHA
jgi:hypothetical protein